MENYTQTSFFNDTKCEQNVDKSVIKVKKRKPIIVKLNEAIIELNLLLLPLALIGRTEISNNSSIVIEWRDSKNRRRGIKISMPDDLTMLTIFDIKVLIALFKINSEKEEVIRYNLSKNKYEIPIEINFTKIEISKRLGYRTCAGTITRKIDDALEKLTGAYISSIFDGGLYDIENKRYITNGKVRYHILELYQTYNYKDINEEKRVAAGKIKDMNKAIVNRFFYDNMCNGYLKSIDFDLLIRIKRDVGVRLYCILEGWFCNKNPFVFFKYETLYARIPLPEDRRTANKNRDIRMACDELVELKYLQKYFTDKKGVYFVYDGSLTYDDIINYRQKVYGLNKYNTLQEIISALVDYNIDGNMIDQYVREDNKEDIAAAIRYYEIYKRYDRIKENDVGFLADAIRGKYKIDKKYRKSS